MVIVKFVELRLWTSPAMQEVRDVAKRAAPIDVTVFVTGETGTGKQLVAGRELCGLQDKGHRARPQSARH